MLTLRLSIRGPVPIRKLMSPGLSWRPPPGWHMALTHTTLVLEACFFREAMTVDHLEERMPTGSLGFFREGSHFRARVHGKDRGGLGRDARLGWKLLVDRSAGDFLLGRPRGGPHRRVHGSDSAEPRYHVSSAVPEPGVSGNDRVIGSGLAVQLASDRTRSGWAGALLKPKCR